MDKRKGEKEMKCYVNIEGFKKTESGKRKVWTTDGVPTYCCCFTPAYFVWEKATRHNNHDPYSGYMNCVDVELRRASK